MEELINCFEEEKESLLKLIELDNKIMHSHISYQDLYLFLQKEQNFVYSIKENTLFITEGNPFLTISILKTIYSTNYQHILFVHQNFLGINKWLIARYNEIIGNQQMILDYDPNYNKYFNLKINILPIGESIFIEEVTKDFNE